MEEEAGETAARRLGEQRASRAGGIEAEQGADAPWEGRARRAARRGKDESAGSREEQRRVTSSAASRGNRHGERRGEPGVPAGRGEQRKLRRGRGRGARRPSRERKGGCALGRPGSGESAAREEAPRLGAEEPPVREELRGGPGVLSIQSTGMVPW
jgi:hypothetical protein